jgi:hypothetical protein
MEEGGRKRGRKSGRKTILYKGNEQLSAC